MSELMKTQAGELLRLLHGTAPETERKPPFARDILLLESWVAGTTHVPGLEALEPYLVPGMRLELLRVPENPSDPFAIKILNEDGLKLGYLPRQDNRIPARLMDAGKLLFAVLTGKRMERNWLKLEIEVYLRDE